MGWRLSRTAWGKGYATEAAAATLQDGFVRCGFERVVATVQAPNSASSNVALKLGMSQLQLDGPAVEVAANEAEGRTAGREVLAYAVSAEEWRAGRGREEAERSRYTAPGAKL